MAKKGYKSKAKDKTSIEEFKNHRLLYRLKKKRSPLGMDFYIEKGEDWFIDVVTYRRKSGVITNESMITEKDLEDWVERCQRISGWEIEETGK